MSTITSKTSLLISEGKIQRKVYLGDIIQSLKIGDFEIANFSRGNVLLLLDKLADRDTWENYFSNVSKDFVIAFSKGNYPHWMIQYTVSNHLSNTPLFLGYPKTEYQPVSIGVTSSKDVARLDYSTITLVQIGEICAGAWDMINSAVLSSRKAAATLMPVILGLISETYLNIAQAIENGCIEGYTIYDLTDTNTLSLLLSQKAIANDVIKSCLVDYVNDLLWFVAAIKEDGSYGI